LRINVLGLALLALVLGGVEPLAAQDDKGYASVSGMLSTQSAATPPPGHSAQPGVGGTAFGVSGDIGAFLAQRVSLAFEVSVPARFESIQHTGDPTAAQIDNQHRDLVFSGLFHFHVTSSGPIRIALVAGPSLVREDTSQRIAYAPSFQSTNFGPYGPETALTRWTVGLSGGADIGFQVGRRVQIVPQLRLHWVDRASFGTDDESVTLSLGSIIIQPAVGVRFSF
jgi:hypothetical protein